MVSRSERLDRSAVRIFMCGRSCRIVARRRALTAIIVSVVIIAALTVVLCQKHSIESDVRLDFNDEGHPLSTTFDGKAVELILEQGDEYYYGLTIKVDGQEYFSVIAGNETVTVGGIDFTVTHMDVDGIDLHLHAEKGLF
jgi:predicted aspartyl protease